MNQTSFQVLSRCFNAAPLHLQVQSRTLQLLYCCAWPEGRVKSSTALGQCVGMLLMPKKREQTLFSESFPRLCWLPIFQANFVFPPCFT